MAAFRVGAGARRAGISAVLVVIALVSAGCSGGGDGARVEEELGKQLADLEFKEINCPEKPKLEKGAAFSCRAVSKNGARTDIEVTQPEAAGQMEFNIAKNELVQVSTAADYLRQRLAEGGKSATVDCGNRERLPVDEGTTLTCRATEANGRSANYTIVAHPTDDDVRITIK